MDKDKLKQLINEALNFNSEEIRYKLTELEKEIEDIKKLLHQVLPQLGQSAVQSSILIEYLKTKGFEDFDQYSNDAIVAAMRNIADSVEDNPELQKELQELLSEDNVLSKSIN